MSKSGFRNWVPKIVNCEIFGCLIFQGRPQYTQIKTINMYLLHEIKHNILIHFQRNYIAKKSIICLKLNLRNYSQKVLI